MSIDRELFATLDETEQAELLVRLSRSAAMSVTGHDDIQETLLLNTALSERLLKGDYDVKSELMKFIEDPDMKSDFGSIYEVINGDEKASAALHIVSYGCAFNLRLAAKKMGLHILPDPVLEALPDIADFYFDQAEILGLT
ncbi:hypothetical protein [uncultured Tateyamaria sp.]|uniref:hypothetical protein n=1 Tax=uncultured Tateyamaria sp. TaxID=455651 RepID=UPI00263706AF|nr:hypothetical protein [uncultured Tateyamaria sp.]